MQFSDSKLKHISRIRKGKQNRENYVASHLRHGLSHQIRLTRESRGLTQSELAKLVGVSQNLISRWESTGYGQYTVSTLNRIASALDVALMVRFVPFSRMVDWLSGTPSVDFGLDVDALQVASFTEEDQKGMFNTDHQQMTIASSMMPHGALAPFNKQAADFVHKESLGNPQLSDLDAVVHATQMTAINQSGVASNFIDPQIIKISQEHYYGATIIEENRR